MASNSRNSITAWALKLLREADPRFCRTSMPFFHRQMKVTEELRPSVSMLSDPLQNLGMEAFAQHDVASAQQFLNRAIELNVKAYGENSSGVSNSLRMLAGMYVFQKDFARRSRFLLRAVKIDETLYGQDGSEALLNLTALCSTYDRWGKSEKSEPCHEHLLAVLKDSMVRITPSWSLS